MGRELYQKSWDYTDGSFAKILVYANMKKPCFKKKNRWAKQRNSVILVLG